ncbi:GNAT family N-acetyltransferase [Legionella saoudiensis]|uniref:GNAT family N-acetyltransferase n=1 Tax=Legionella saoudiensis TaxID=1750561 RepID=UPI000730F301|nr:GNAT family N-acetyltransferase [Legionella saoudiensis]
MNIETIHLLIRQPTINDFLLLQNLWRNEQVRKFLGGSIPDDLIPQKISALQEHWDLHQFGLSTVFEKNSNEIAGLCGLHYSDDGVELSYMFFPNWWGQGLAYEAAVASINYGFKTLHLNRIIAITQAENTKSCLLLKKAGMNYLGSFERFNAIQNLYETTKNKWQIK